MITNTTLLKIFVSLLFLNTIAFSQTPFLVKNIAASGSSTPSNLTNVNGTLFFTANDGVNGVELWKSDGTASGTTLVKDISAGTGSSNPTLLTNVNGTLFFAATDAVNGTELWKSDGTNSGTMLVKDIYPGTNSSSLSSLINMNGTLFFSATPDNATTFGYELWKSDGTATGTVIVKDIYPGWQSSSPKFLTIVNNFLFFQANDGVNGVELWKSDGTNTGTTLVKDIASGSSAPDYLINVNGTLFFWASVPGGSGAADRELWKSDGTATGTILVKDINVGGGSSESGTTINPMLNFNGILFFIAYDGSAGVGYELWKTDGTSGGTVLVKDINTGFSNSSINYLMNVNNTIYFSANDGISGQELWKSDGTTTGTVLVKDIVNGSGGVSPRYLIAVNGVLYFEGNNGSYLLWKSDGTTAGTVSLNSSNPNNFCLVNNTLFFLGYELTGPSSGAELWAINTVSGIEENTLQNTISIFPNPATSTLNIIGITVKATLKLFDLVGNLVLQEEIETNTTINTSQLAQGIYTLVTEGKNGRAVNKVVISK